MSLCCSTPFRVFSKQKRREAYSGLVTNMGMLSTLKTVHEYRYNLADSVNIAHSNALLSYGKKGRDVDTFDELRYTMVMTTDKSATVLPPTEDAFKEHVIHAKCLLWFGAKATSQSKSWLNQLVIAGQLATMDSSLRQCTICSRWGSRPDSSILYI